MSNDEPFSIEELLNAFASINLKFLREKILWQSISEFQSFIPDVEHVEEADEEEDDEEDDDDDDDDDGPFGGYMDDAPPARLFESIIGCTMRRLALMNLGIWYKKKKKLNY